MIHLLQYVTDSITGQIRTECGAYLLGMGRATTEADETTCKSCRLTLRWEYLNRKGAKA